MKSEDNSPESIFMMIESDQDSENLSSHDNILDTCKIDCNCNLTSNFNPISDRSTCQSPYPLPRWTIYKLLNQSSATAQTHVHQQDNIATEHQPQTTATSTKRVTSLSNMSSDNQQGQRLPIRPPNPPTLRCGAPQTINEYRTDVTTEWLHAWTNYLSLYNTTINEIKRAIIELNIKSKYTKDNNKFIIVFCDVKQKAVNQPAIPTLIVHSPKKHMRFKFTANMNNNHVNLEVSEIFTHPEMNYLEQKDEIDDYPPSVLYCDMPFGNNNTSSNHNYDDRKSDYYDSDAENTGDNNNVKNRKYKNYENIDKNVIKTAHMETKNNNRSATTTNKNKSKKCNNYNKSRNSGVTTATKTTKNFTSHNVRIPSLRLDPTQLPSTSSKGKSMIFNEVDNQITTETDTRGFIGKQFSMSLPPKSRTGSVGSKLSLGDDSSSPDADGFWSEKVSKNKRRDEVIADFQVTEKKN